MPYWMQTLQTFVTLDPIQRVRDPETPDSIEQDRLSALHPTPAHRCCQITPKMSTILRTLRNLRRIGLKVGRCARSIPPVRCLLTHHPFSRIMAIKCRYALPRTPGPPKSAQLAALEWLLTLCAMFSGRIVYWYGTVSTRPEKRERVTDASATTGDTKAGTLIGVDRYGNKYFENMEEELPRE